MRPRAKKTASSNEKPAPPCVVSRPCGLLSLHLRGRFGRSMADNTYDPRVPARAVKLLASLTKDPSYTLDHDEVSALVDDEFPSLAQVPSIPDLDDSVLRMSKSGLLFDNGQWVRAFSPSFIRRELTQKKPRWNASATT